MESAGAIGVQMNAIGSITAVFKVQMDPNTPSTYKTRCDSALKDMREMSRMLSAGDALKARTRAAKQAVRRSILQSYVRM